MPQVEKVPDSSRACPNPKGWWNTLCPADWARRWDASRCPPDLAGVLAQSPQNSEVVHLRVDRARRRRGAPHLRQGAADLDRSLPRGTKHPPKPMTPKHLDATKDACFRNRTLSSAGAREDPRSTSPGQT